ncbi:beta-ketoacyl synthase N-terminal-like domain-containing protein [Streptomyces sp. NPDC004244]
MDEKEVLTRFKNGHLDRAHAAALLAGRVGPRTAQPAQDGPAAGAAGRAAAEGVAVVGMAGRYPGAPDLASLWHRTQAGLGGDSAPPPGRPGDERGHYLERVQDFDAEFFGIDPDEAALTDPQERLFLETAWEALEDAGCTGSRLDALTAPDGTPRSVGVFTGAGTGDYALLAARSWTRERPRPMPRSGQWSLPNRLSSLLGLTGPSQSVDTAESSVLVALHHALAALRAGECAAALVGGVHLLLHPAHRRPGAGEGVGALLLKPLDRALADGDTVHCVIRGSAVGHTAPDSSTAGPGRRSRAATAPHEICAGTPAAPAAPVAPAAPNAPAPRVLRAALRAAAVDGCGIAVREDAASVRDLVGAAGAATGAAALTLAVLRLRHRAPAPGRDAEDGTPDGGPGTPLRARVGVRGAGGVDAHVILEEYVPPAADTADTAAGTAADTGDAPDGDRTPAGRELFVLSAPTPAHLAATARRFAALLAGPGPVPPLGALARALRTGRAAMDCRFAAVVADTDELADALQRFAGGTDPCADLRDGGADPLALGGLPETDGYLAALWQAGHLAQLRGLWLSGLDVDWAALERTPGAGAVSVPLPASAFLRTPLWIGGGGEGEGEPA